MTRPVRNASRPTPSRALPLALGLTLVAATFVAYYPAVRGGFIWDDDSYVTKNPTLRSTQGLASIWSEPAATPQYYPLVHTSYWIEYRLWGLHPTGYHIVNVLLHTASAFLLWRVLVALRVPGSWLAAAIFAIHPVHVESVAWITERKNVLSGVFYLAAATAYLRFAFEPGPTAPRRTRILWYAASLALFLGALFSKTVTGSLPAALLLVLWWKRGRLRITDVYPLVPFFVLALGLGSLTAIIEKHHVGALGNDWSFSPTDRCLIAGRALWFYAGKLVWPSPLSFVYPRWIIDSAQWWQYLFPLAASGVVAALWLARRPLGRGPLTAVLFFAGTLVPALGFFNVYPMRYSFVADHFQYLASIGLIVLAVAAGTKAAAQPGSRRKAGASVLAAGIIVLLGVLTWRQGHVYADHAALWHDTLRKNPSAWMAHNNLGILLEAEGRIHDAIRHYTEAANLKTDYPEAYYNRAHAHTLLGDPHQAIQDYTRAIELRPAYPEAYNNRGIIFGQTGDLPRALQDYTQAIDLKPDHAEAYNNRGYTYTQLGDLARAIQDCTKAIELRPGMAEAYNNRGDAYRRKGEPSQAIADCTRAIELKPNLAEAYHNRAMAHFALKDHDRAWADVEMCRQLGGTPHPDFIKALTEASGRSQ